MDYIILDSFLHYFMILGLFISLGVWIYWSFKNKCQKNYAIAPILFSINALLFGISAEFNLLSKSLFVIWGDIVSLHGTIILIIIGILLIQYYTGGKK